MESPGSKLYFFSLLQIGRTKIWSSLTFKVSFIIFYYRLAYVSDVQASYLGKYLQTFLNARVKYDVFVDLVVISYIRNVYIWKCRLGKRSSPSGDYKNQIDYIPVDKKWRTSFSKQCQKHKSGAQSGSDYHLLWAYLRVKTQKNATNWPPRRQTQ